MAAKKAYKPAEPKAPAGPFAKKLPGTIRSRPLTDKKIYKPSDANYTPPGMPGPNKPPVPFVPKSRGAKLPK